MSTPPAGLDIRPLTVPASLDAPDARAFSDMVRVRNRVYREISGHDDHALTAEEVLPRYQPDDYQIRYAWTVVWQGELVGRIGVDIPLEEGSRSAFWLIELLPEVWGRGIGSAAHELVERAARQHGRTVLQAWAEHPDAPGDRVSAPTGFGSIPLDHIARFFARHGYALEQVERNSALDPSADPARIDRLHEQAADAATGYRVILWTAPTPEEHVEAYAWMKSRMSTDAPAAGMEIDEEVWDVTRVRRHEALYLDAGRVLQVAAAQHLATGDLVAFTELSIGADRTRATHQDDTLVVRSHRGHRLGMLVKTAGLRAWRAVAPTSPRVVTYNAEENRPMLDVNEAIGFVPVAYEGAWKKVLDD